MTGPERAEHNRRLFVTAYDRLKKKIAGVASRQPNSTLSVTGLLHEVWLKLDRSNQEINDTNHLGGLVYTASEQVMHDRYRAKHAAKRDPGVRVPMPANVPDPSTSSIEELHAITLAFDQLSAENPELALIMKGRFVTGASIAELAETFAVSERTIGSRLRLGETWLRKHLRGGEV